MRDLIEHYGLGVFVEPDSSEAVADGMATLLNSELPEPNWEEYESYATWETNVTRLVQASIDLINNRPTPQRQFEGLEDEAMPLPTIIKARSLLKSRPERVKKSPPTQRETPPFPKSELKTPSQAASPTGKKRGRPPKAVQSKTELKAAPVESKAGPVSPAKRGRKPKVVPAADANSQASKVAKSEASITPEPPVKRGRKPKIAVVDDGMTNGSAKAAEAPVKKVTAKKAKDLPFSTSEKSPIENSRIREVNLRRRALRRRRAVAASSKN
jgi:hypothetical protein